MFVTLPSEGLIVLFIYIPYKLNKNLTIFALNSQISFNEREKTLVVSVTQGLIFLKKRDSWDSRWQDQ